MLIGSSFIIWKTNDKWENGVSESQHANKNPVYPFYYFPQHLTVNKELDIPWEKSNFDDKFH